MKKKKKCLAAFIALIGVMLIADGAFSRVVAIPPMEAAAAARSATIGPAIIDPSPYEGGEDPGCASVEIARNRLVVRAGPSSDSKRRGVAMKGARLPAYSRVRGPGCADYWYRVHDEAWVCGTMVDPTDEPPTTTRYPILGDGDLTPWPYAFVHTSTIEYRPQGGVLFEIRDLLKGYGFGVDGVVHLDEGSFFRTVEGNLIPRDAAGISGRISQYGGVAIAEGGAWPVGWVNNGNAWSYATPSRDKRHRVRKVERYSPFEVLETVGAGAKRFVRFDDGAWLWGRDVRVARATERPAAVAEGEKWIDVDVSEQVITAYEGDRPVYAAMVSTGRGGASRTVMGEYRIWVKVSAIAMDNTDEELDDGAEDGAVADGGLPEEDRHLFSLQDVPWTQFFHENYALHGVYWHDRYGNRRSHGCVNLAPNDARWFYEWTRPRVPDGWWAIHSSDGDRGTLVRVR